MRSPRLSLVAIAILFLFVAYNQQKQTQVDAPIELDAVESADFTSVVYETVTDTSGPIDNCLHHAQLYFRQENLNSECTLNYVHFYPSLQPSPGPETKETIKIASFNVFHLGDNQSSMKKIPLLARIMNQWDVIGAQELMPLPSAWANDNVMVYKLLTNPQGEMITFPYDDWKVVLPGYLQVLKELRKLDPTWALIMQSQAEGEGSSGEMAGFYYRSSIVQPKEWGYCPISRSQNIKTKEPARNFACLAQVPPEQRKLMSRAAFLAYFKSGQFDFVGMTAHARFREDPNAQNRAAQQSAICENTELEQCSIAKDLIGRFYEVLAVANQVKSVREHSKDLDIIFMGDFNIELNDRTEPFWQAALKQTDGMRAYQLSPTTLSVPKNQLRSNYDHFLMDQRLSQECSVESIRSYDFMSAEANHPDPVMQEIAAALSPSAREEWLNERVEGIKKLIRPVSARQTFSLRAINEKEESSMVRSFRRSVTRMQKNKAGALLELISDHLPIEISCRTDQKDDD